MSTKMSPVVHFEIPAGDTRRICEFYEKVFGWQTEHMGPQMGNYVVVSTSERGQNPCEPDTIQGVGLYIAFVDTEGNRLGMLQPAPMG